MNPDPLEPARLVRVLLRLYPAEWRERFADEFAAVLVAVLAAGPDPGAGPGAGDGEDAAGSTGAEPSKRKPGGRRGSGRAGRLWTRARIAADVVGGAVDARLQRAFGPAAAGRSVGDRVRTSAQVAFCAFALFCVAGTGFQKMTEDLPFQAVARTHAAIGWSFDVVLYGAIAAAVFVLAGSLPVLVAVARQALAGRRDLRVLLAVPPVAGAVWLGGVFAITRLAHAPRHSAVNVAAFALVVVAFHVVAAVSAGALVIAARRAELPARVKRAQWLPMTGLSLAMVSVTVGDLVWGLTLHAQAPGLFDSHNGLLATPLPATWVSTLAGMGLATAVAVAATLRAIVAIRAGRGHDPGDPPPAPAQSAGLIRPVS